MPDPISDSSEAKPSWPQEGIFFYLLWVGGLVAFSIVSRLAMFSGLPVMRDDWFGRLFFTGAAIGLHAWQAWLLFRSPVRAVLWSLLPVLSLTTGSNYKLIQLFGVLVPILETPLLAGVRQRPWAWLLAGMGQVVLSVAGYAVFPQLVVSLAHKIGGTVATQALLTTAIYSGWWLVLEAMAAVVLAWWMPPVATRGSGTAPPPLAESTDG